MSYTDLTEEQKENRREWVEALRSGDYKQGQGNLFASKDDREEYCCLGVACSILGYKKQDIVNRSFLDSPYIENYEDSSKFVEKPSEKFGLRQFQIEALAHLNDNGVPFTDIAEVIESDFDINLIYKKLDVKDDGYRSIFEPAIKKIIKENKAGLIGQEDGKL